MKLWRSILIAMGLTATPVAAAPLDDAFRAAFGKSKSATIVSTDSDLREQVRYTPGALVEARFGPVLIAIGEVTSPAHASSGKVAAIYLKRTGKGFAVTRRFVPAMETGSFGQIGDWSVTDEFGPNPVVMVEGGGIFQGYLCSVTTWLELTPQGPRELLTIPMSYDNSGAVGDDQATRIEGRIADFKPGEWIDVAYSGSRVFTERYVRSGDRYAIAGADESRMETC